MKTVIHSDTIKNIDPGMKVWLKPIKKNGVRRGPNMQGTVTKIGQWYFYVDVEGKEYKFSIADASFEPVKDEPGFVIYQSEGLANPSVEYHKQMQKLQDFFRASVWSEWPSEETVGKICEMLTKEGLIK